MRPRPPAVAASRRAARDGAARARGRRTSRRRSRPAACRGELEQRGEEGRTTPERVDLDHRDQRADERVVEGDRPGVVPHRAQPQDHLAQGLAPAQGLDGRREDDEHEDEGADERRGEQGLVGLERRDRGEQHHADEQQQGDGDVDQTGGDPRAEARRGQVERDRLTGDQVVGRQRRELRSRHPGQHRAA